MPGKTIRVVSFDPGVTTGVAWATISDKTVQLQARQDVYNHRDIYGLATEPGLDAVVCEGFEFRQRVRDKLILVSVEYIGVLKLAVPEDRLYIQSAATGKGYYTDRALKEKGVYLRGVPHGMDALRHLLHWYTFGAGYKYNKDQEWTIANRS